MSTKGREGTSRSRRQPVVLLIAVLILAAYEDFLRRTTDESGMQYWTGYLATGGRVDVLEASLIGSSELASRVGAQSTSEYVDILYRIPQTLGRPAVPGGVAYWIDQIDHHGLSRTTATLAFFDSPEAQLLAFSRATSNFGIVYRGANRQPYLALYQASAGAVAPLDFALIADWAG